MELIFALFLLVIVLYYALPLILIVCALMFGGPREIEVNQTDAAKTHIEHRTGDDTE